MLEASAILLHVDRCSQDDEPRARHAAVYDGDITLEAQLPIYWVPVLKTLHIYTLSGTQGPTIWVPGLLG